MEHNIARVLNQLEQRIIALDWLIATSPAVNLVHEFEALYFDRRAHLVELADDDADFHRDAADLLQRSEAAILLMGNLHLSLTEPAR